jgi:hypothetical protein
MEHIKMSILKLYIEDHSEPLKDQGLNCQYIPRSGFMARSELLEQSATTAVDVGPFTLH